jgi:MFS family permease
MVLFGMPFQSLMPVFAEILDAEALGYGFLMAMVGVGAAVSSLAVASLGDFRRKGLLLLGFGVSFGITLVIFANSVNLYLSLIVLTLVGVSSTGFMAVNNTLIQMNISDDVRGRVMSIYMMTFGLMPLGTLPMGAIAEAMGAPFAVTLGGGLMAGVIVALGLLHSSLRRME